MLLSKAPYWLQKVFKIQCAMVFVVGSCVFFISVETAYAIFLGAIVYGLPKLWVLWREFGTMGASHKTGINAPLSLLQLYRLEVIKVSLTVGLFIAVFAGVKPLNGLAVLVTYAVLHISALTLSLVITKSDSIN